VSHAVDGEPVEMGRIYVAPPDRHLLVEPRRIRLSHGPTENRHRPAIDPLFRSAARAYGPRVVVVVLTGSLDDGTAGMYAIRRRRGIAVVQDPADALFPSMPSSVLEYVGADYRVPLSEMAALLVELAHLPSATDAPEAIPDEVTEEAVAFEAHMTNPDEPTRKGTPSVFTCPDCHGTLWELGEAGHLQFRCRVGHAYTGDGLIAAQGEASEQALWAALRALEESAALAERMARRARDRNNEAVATRFDRRRAEAVRNAGLVRTLLVVDESELPAPSATS
jgi:two-component system chemotaxis response regulator CheB